MPGSVRVWRCKAAARSLPGQCQALLWALSALSGSIWCESAGGSNSTSVGLVPQGLDFSAERRAGSGIRSFLREEVRRCFL